MQWLLTLLGQAWYVLLLSLPLGILCLKKPNKTKKHKHLALVYCIPTTDIFSVWVSLTNAYYTMSSSAGVLEEEKKIICSCKSWTSDKPLNGDAYGERKMEKERGMHLGFNEASRVCHQGSSPLCLPAFQSFCWRRVRERPCLSWMERNIRWRSWSAWIWRVKRRHRQLLAEGHSCQEPSRSAISVWRMRYRRTKKKTYISWETDR